MNSDAASNRKIEIFAPCEAALSLTKLILFQPFDLGKWCVIGFAAFLSHLAGGGGGGNGFSFKGGNPFKNATWNIRSSTHDAINSAGTWPGWVVPLLIIGGIVGFAFVVLLWWIGSRGRFIFIDCIVRNRGRIAEPWHEFRKQGNSFFGFLLLVSIALILLFGLASTPLWLPLLLNGTAPRGVQLALGIVLIALVAICFMVFVGITSTFMVPIMYRRRCRAAEAFQAALGLLATHPGPVILFFLFSVVLWIAFALVACLTTCLTCCITAIPYVGTVILLPAHVFFGAYLLLFLRQFGPDFDVWANVNAIESPASIGAATHLPSPPAAEPPPFQS